MTTETQRSRSALGLVLVGALAIIAVATYTAMRPAQAPVGHSAAVATDDAGAAESPPVPAAAADLKLQTSEDPESSALSALVEEYGYKCTTGSEISFQMRPGALEAYDKAIAEQKIDGDWVTEGEAFAGDPLEAAVAYSGTKAFAHEDGPVWVIVPGEKPMALELQPMETPAKNVVWIPMNRITECVGHP